MSNARFCELHQRTYLWPDQCPRCANQILKPGDVGERYRNKDANMLLEPPDFDPDTLVSKEQSRQQRMDALGITEQDIAETMPPKPEDER